MSIGKRDSYSSIHLGQDRTGQDPCPVLTETRREIFDLQEILCDDFDWNVSQILRFMRMGPNIWEHMDQQL
jgi:hypothetical protein